MKLLCFCFLLLNWKLYAMTLSYPIAIWWDLLNAFAPTSFFSLAFLDFAFNHSLSLFTANHVIKYMNWDSYSDPSFSFDFFTIISCTFLVQAIIHSYPMYIITFYTFASSLGFFYPSIPHHNESWIPNTILTFTRQCW